jgi:hypothetical protein
MQEDSFRGTAKGNLEISSFAATQQHHERRGEMTDR